MNVVARIEIVRLENGQVLTKAQCRDRVEALGMLSEAENFIRSPEPKQEAKPNILVARGGLPKTGT